MSFKHLAWAFETPVRWPAKPVLVALANRMNDKTGQCNPSLPQIAADIGKSRGSVREIRRALNELRDLGYIEIYANFAGKGQQTSNSYKLHLGFIHEDPNTGGRAESPTGAESPPPTDERPVHSARAVSPGRVHSPGVGAESPTNQELNPLTSSTTEEVTRTRENDDLDALEAEMVDQISGGPDSGAVEDDFDWFAHLGKWSA